MNNITILILTILVVNLIAFALYAIDKYKAVKGKWRIPEKILLTWSFFAPWGAFLGMKVVRHKTKHKKFTILIPLFMVSHIVAVLYLIYGYR